jgi:protein associated with RNAse G/E
LVRQPRALRSPVGFDYLDHELDLHVYPDRRWELLDVDEFEAA